MAILLSGAFGFVGSHVLERLILSDLRMRTVALYHTCCMDNIKNVVGNPAFQMVKGDIRKYEDVDNAVKGVDSIIHLAALINVDESMFIPREYWETNVNGTLNLLEAARKHDVKKLTYMSTAEINGYVKEGKANEETAVEPRSPYASSKYAAERACLSYMHTYGTPVTIVRAFNTYGPRQRSDARGAVIAKFITSALNNRNLQMTGTGDQTRDYTYVKDLADGIVRAHMSYEADRNVLIIASGVEIKIRKIAESVISITGTSSKIENMEVRTGENMRSVGDSSKARKMLGWMPITPFEEGLMDTVRWYRSQMSK